MPIVTPADIATKLGRDLTTAEQTDVAQRVAAAIEIIEAQLHRTVDIAQYSEQKLPLAESSGMGSVANGWSILGTGGARVHPTHRPVASLVSVTGVHTATNYTAGTYREGDTFLVPTREPVQIVYVAGDDPPSPLVKRMIVRALTRELFQPAVVSSGAFRSYSVEGSSYAADAPAADETWPFNNQEMRSMRMALGRLQIR